MSAPSSSRVTHAQDFFYLDQWPDLFPSIAELAPGEHPFLVRYAMRHLSLLIEPAIYLPRLMQEVRQAGGNIVVREMRAVPEVLALDEPVIFNCCGLGARELFGDDGLIPARGQLVFMPPDERVDYITHGRENPTFRRQEMMGIPRIRSGVHPSCALRASRSAARR